MLLLFHLCLCMCGFCTEVKGIKVAVRGFGKYKDLASVVLCVCALGIGLLCVPEWKWSKLSGWLIVELSSPMCGTMLWYRGMLVARGCGAWQLGSTTVSIQDTTMFWINNPKSQWGMTTYVFLDTVLTSNPKASVVCSNKNLWTMSHVYAFLTSTLMWLETTGHMKALLLVKVGFS